MTLLSAIVLVRNEALHIEGCLESICQLTLPADCELEVLVVDGRSNDGTREKVETFSRRDGRVRLLDNPQLITPCAMNIGARAARGAFIAIFSGHATYPADYLVQCYQTAQRTGADNVGGLVIPQNPDAGFSARLVQALTTHRFGVGNSGFRVGMREGEADTVPYGFYRREVFDKIGFMDERLVRAQDYEFNRRLCAAGGRIWLNPAIQIAYFNQSDISKFLSKQILKEGPYNTYLWYLAPYAFAVRHGITGLFVLGVLGGALLWPWLGWAQWIYLGVLGLYAVLAMVATIQQAVRYRDVRLVSCLPSCFFLFHFLHGLGVLKGALKLLMGTAPVQQAQEPWPGAGRKRAWPPLPPSK
ncbi:MAG: glycosyltransferase family 2 protein [Pedosphaera sp.]|nr:glycosyltransferase family 2 protein [Pedosphaera sp.]